MDYFLNICKLCICEKMIMIIIILTMAYEGLYRQVPIPISGPGEVVTYNIPPPTGNGRYSKIVISDVAIENLHLRSRNMLVEEAIVQENTIILPDSEDVRNGQTSIVFTAIRIPMFKKAVVNVHKCVNNIKDFYT